MKFAKPKMDTCKESKKKNNQCNNSNEDVEEEENHATHSSNNKDSGDDNCKPSFFGVRSYIHHFYEPVSANDGFKSDSEDTDEARYLIAPKKNRKGTNLWKYTFWLGTILLSGGMSTLLYGYITPEKEETIGKQAELTIKDPNAKQFNIRLDHIKVIGLVVFCAGGSIVALTLILASLVGVSWNDEDDDLDDSGTIKVTLPSGDNIVNDDCKVPVTEEVTSIQPSRQADESVVTGSGLTLIK